MTETIGLVKSSHWGHVPVGGPPNTSTSRATRGTAIGRGTSPNANKVALPKLSKGSSLPQRRCPSLVSSSSSSSSPSSSGLQHSLPRPSPAVRHVNAKTSAGHKAGADSSGDRTSSPRPVSSLAAYSVHTTTGLVARRRQYRPSSVSPNPPRVRTTSSSGTDAVVEKRPASSHLESTRQLSFNSSTPVDSPTPPPLRPRALSDQGPRPSFTKHPALLRRRAFSSNSPDCAAVGPDLSQQDSAHPSHPRPFALRRFSYAASTAVAATTGAFKSRLIDRRVRSNTDSNVLSAAASTSSTASIRRGRELLILKTSSLSSSPNDIRHFSSHRHRLSTKSLGTNVASPSSVTPVRVPPIRNFRSSGSRKSVTLDMNYDPRYVANGDGPRFAQVEQPLRRFDPRQDSDVRHVTPPVSGRQTSTANEDGGDVFLNIARDEAYHHADSERSYGGIYTPMSASSRLGHRRPLSTHVASYHPVSPPKYHRRRMSDQQDRPGLEDFDGDQGNEPTIVSSYRSLARDRPASAHPAEDTTRIRAGSALRPTPLTPRSPVYQENADPLKYTRRRSSVAESTPPLSGRQYKSNALAFGHTKNYSSSPLVRSFDARSQLGNEAPHGVDGTESTLSTNAPSTLWDEVDELKSRLHRLELTGRLPPTSGAAVTGLTGERPVTANTTVTTASLSPKRPTAASVDAQSAISPQRDNHPLLHTALSKSRHLLSNDIFHALEYVAQDALSLSSMMGSPGHPISSGASAIGSTTGVSDRQLRRKAESVCRGLTELCLALNEEAAHGESSQAPVNLEQHRSTPTTPTIPKSANGFPTSRRSSIVQDQQQSVPPSQSTSRLMSRYEDRRQTAAQGSAPPVSFHTNPHHSDGMARRSSLLIGRTRRGRTEEPEEGRESPFLRTRKPQTMEPEQSEQLFASNQPRSKLEDSPDIKPPAMSPTEAERNDTPDSERTSENQGVPIDTESAVSSAAPPRRRFVSDLHSSSRLAAPAMNGNPSQRKYLERSTPDRDVGNRTPDFGVTRRFSLHSRTGSLSSRRPNRDSMIPAGPGSTSGQHQANMGREQ